MTDKKEKIKDFFIYSLFQLRIWKKIYAGITHFMIFWGVLIQVVGTAINLMQMRLFTPFELPIPRAGGYLFYEWIMDLAGVFIIVGVLMALIRRLVMRPKYMGYKWDDYFAIVLLTLMALAGFTTEGMRLLSVSPDWNGYSFIGSYVADLLLAWGVFLANGFSLILAILFVPVMNLLQIIPEERAMELNFREHYITYKARVRRWF